MVNCLNKRQIVENGFERRNQVLKKKVFSNAATLGYQRQKVHKKYRCYFFYVCVVVFRLRIECIDLLEDSL